MKKLPDVADEYKNRFGVKEFIKGIKGGNELKIEEVFTPTCTICGLNSGYQGPGSKTVQPARASAKVDFRLEPEQMPEPKFVISVGSCSISGGVFEGCYNCVGSVDDVIPVDVYIPGCPPRPEAIIDGIVQLLTELKGGKARKQQRPVIAEEIPA